MFCKIHKSYRYVVAICDSDLLGKYFEEPSPEGFTKQLDVKEAFYKGEETDAQDIKKIMHDLSREDATFNIVGERAVQCAVETGIITEDSIRKIQGIPFALVLL